MAAGSEAKAALASRGRRESVESFVLGKLEGRIVAGEGVAVEMGVGRAGLARSGRVA